MPAYGACGARYFNEGGAVNSNVFTCNCSALYDQSPWRAVPVTPVEIICCRAGFRSIYKVSYWAGCARTADGTQCDQATGA